MSDSFRDLERPVSSRRPDVVLMATVTSFEAMRRPARRDLRQFAELFVPLFRQSSAETRRMAAAALSRCAILPGNVVAEIVAEPVSVSAPFLAHAPTLGETHVLAIAERCGIEHARALARRKDLTPASAQALAALGDPVVLRSLALRGFASLTAEADSSIAAASRDLKAAPAAAASGTSTGRTAGRDRMAPAASAAPAASSAPLRPSPIAASHAAGTADDSEDLRRRLKSMALPGSRSRFTPPSGIAEGVPSPVASGVDAAHRPRLPEPGIVRRLARFAAEREPLYFATALADALQSSFGLAERIMLDISGRQLTDALVALGLAPQQVSTALSAFFPHLAEVADGMSLADAMVGACDAERAAARVATWQRADRLTRDVEVHVPQVAEDRRDDPRAADRATRAFRTARPDQGDGRLKRG